MINMLSQMLHRNNDIQTMKGEITSSNTDILRIVSCSFLFGIDLDSMAIKMKLYMWKAKNFLNIIFIYDSIVYIFQMQFSF